MIIVSHRDDLGHPFWIRALISLDLNSYNPMLFSKSFGYAVRSMLYLAQKSDDPRNIQVEELADKLDAPQHFLAKILKILVKSDLLLSYKGPNGGFHINRNTLKTPLIDILEITDSREALDQCALQWKQCNANKPCPIHHLITPVKNELIALCKKTTLGDLMKDPPLLLRSLTR